MISFIKSCVVVLMNVVIWYGIELSGWLSGQPVENWWLWLLGLLIASAGSFVIRAIGWIDEWDKKDKKNGY